jgi:hypothetical protein
MILVPHYSYLQENRQKSVQSNLRLCQRLHYDLVALMAGQPVFLEQKVRGSPVFSFMGPI